LVYRGLQIGVNTTNKFARTVVLGLTSMFAFQVTINTGVVMGLLPTKGLALPFLSSGGSSLLVTCVLIGLILNVQQNSRREKLEK